MGEAGLHAVCNAIRMTKKKMVGARENSAMARAIRACAVFSTVKQAPLRRLAAASFERSLAPRRVLASLGRPFPLLGIVVRGSIVCEASSEGGRDQLLYEARPTETFAETIMLDEGRMLAHFAAGSDGAHLVLIPRAAVVAECAHYPMLALCIAKATAHRARILVERLVTFAFSSTTSRVARALLGRVPTTSGWVDAPLDVRRWSQTQIALLAGT